MVHYVWNNKTWVQNEIMENVSVLLNQKLRLEGKALFSFLIVHLATLKHFKTTDKHEVDFSTQMYDVLFATTWC